jgi:hypothetical protein
MSALLNRADQAVSATAMVRSFGARLKDVTSGEVTHLVIFKDNEPAAVLKVTKRCRMSSKICALNCLPSSACPPWIQRIR